MRGGVVERERGSAQRGTREGAEEAKEGKSESKRESQ